MSSKEKSLLWVMIVLAISVILFSWGTLASSFSGAHSTVPGEFITGLNDPVIEADETAIWVFLLNAVKQLPNFPEVLSWHLSHRIWLPILLLCLLVAVVTGCLFMRKLERRLFKHHRRS
jgi:hypothetical protein